MSTHFALYSFLLCSLLRTTRNPPAGMNLESYFLSFARLARRTALFWGHAVTSGVATFDGISTGEEMVANSTETGGVDYFVSSWLFEDQEAGRLAQRKYTERCVSNRTTIVTEPAWLHGRERKLQEEAYFLKNGFYAIYRIVCAEIGADKVRRGCCFS